MFFNLNFLFFFSKTELVPVLRKMLDTPLDIITKYATNLRLGVSRMSFIGPCIAVFLLRIWGHWSIQASDRNINWPRRKITGPENKYFLYLNEISSPYSYSIFLYLNEIISQLSNSSLFFFILLPQLLKHH